MDEDTTRLLGNGLLVVGLLCFVRGTGMLTLGSPRPNGEVTDQHRFTILRNEYEEATQGTNTLDFEIVR